jgi:hypothetical protein
MTDQEHAEEIRSAVATLLTKINQAVATGLDIKVNIIAKGSVNHPKHGTISRDWDGKVEIFRTTVL